MKSAVPLANWTVRVSWSMSSPPAPAETLFHWPAEIFPAHPLEVSLGWPAGTLALLDRAFALRLSRFTGWDIEALSQKEAALAAARVFRRGVAVKDQTPSTASGTYALTAKPQGEAWEMREPALIDATVARHFGIEAAPGRLLLQLDESSKTLSGLAPILSWLHQHPGEVSIVGGGLLADAGAFACALLNRPFELVPTTLLAMLDACVGGKTGVNSETFGKNQIGLFAFPIAVPVHLDWLLTLPVREWKAGLAEAFKHALIAGRADWLSTLALPDLNPSRLLPLLGDLIAVKAEVISRDPAELGERATLNLGHTLAHAIERLAHASNEAPLLHGEAVSVGMVFALQLSHELGYLPQKAFEDMSEALKRSSFLIKPQDLRRSLPKLSAEDFLKELLEGIGQDKKNKEGGRSAWVLLKGWGEFQREGAAYTVSLTAEQIRPSLSRFIASWLTPDAAHHE